MENLVSWAVEQGLTDSPPTGPYQTQSENSEHFRWGKTLQVAYFQDGSGRGLAAVRTIKKGEVIIEAPERLLISVKSAQYDRHLKSLLPKYGNLSSTQILAVHILHELAKGPESFWFCYLKQMPHQYTTLACFSECQAAALRVDEAMQTATEAADVAKADWVGALPLLRELELRKKYYTFKAWLWASSTISSRTLYVPWDPAGALCPIVDLLNYAPPGQLNLPANETTPAGTDCSSEKGESASVSGRDFNQGEEDDADMASYGVEISEQLTDGTFSVEDGVYRIFARQDYNPGDQVYLCYGAYSNLELLEHYGFLLPLNPCEKASITLPLPQRTTGTPVISTERQMALLEELGMSPRASAFHLSVNGRPSFSLLAALRYFASSAHVRREVRPLILTGVSPSPTADLAVFNWLRDLCWDELDSLGVISEEEMNLVQSYGQGEEEKGEIHGEEDFEKVKLILALQWRKSQREIFIKCLKFCQGKISALADRVESSQPIKIIRGFS